MNDLMNYVYMPLWLVIALTLLAGIGFEFLVYRIIRLMKRAMDRKQVREIRPKIEVVHIGERVREKANEK